MVKFQDDFYADVRIEDRSRTTISYKAGIPEEMKTRVERRAFLRYTTVRCGITHL